MITPKQFNNITERVVDDLKQVLSSESQISIAAASFSIYAYEALKEELESQARKETQSRKKFELVKQINILKNKYNG